jgi:hypothetical protein
VLQLAGLATTGLVGATGIGAAQPDHANYQGPPEHAGQQGPPEHARIPGWARVKNGQLKITISESEWESAPPASEIKGVPDEARRLSHDMMDQGVEAINQAIAAGDFDLEEQDGQPTLTFSNSGGQNNRGDTQ